MRIYKDAAKLYGIDLSYCMTPLEHVPTVKKIMGKAVRFIAVPQFKGSNPLHDHGTGYVERLKKYHKHGARIAKFWTAPRIFDLLDQPFASHPLRLNSPLRLHEFDALEFLAALSAQVPKPYEQKGFIKHRLLRY